MSPHIELHYCRTARDSARLEHGGLPRYDLEPTRCSGCGTWIGEVANRDGTAVAWRPFAVVVWEDGLDALCVGRCLKALDKIIGIS